ncbi:hypothetical protein [Paenimyroides ceti]
MKNISLFTLFFVCFFSAYSQKERSRMVGKIVSKSRDLEGVYIKNKTSGESAVTERGGYFNILTQPNDTLLITGINLKGKRKIITYAEMNKKLVFIPMETQDFLLDELIIDRTVTSKSLGIEAKRRMTPAERRLHTATSSGGGIIPVDVIINAITGRTRMLKRALEFERAEKQANDIVSNFEERYYTEKLHIPQPYITAFGYYLAEDDEVLRVIKTSNKEQLRLLFSEKAIEFLELIKVLQ